MKQDTKLVVSTKHFRDCSKEVRDNKSTYCFHLMTRQGGAEFGIMYLLYIPAKRV